MNQLVVDIADCKVTNDPDTEIVTYSLGSCIGIAIWDPQAKVGGMLHYMLSDSKVSPDRVKDKPAMFADTGIPMLFKQAYTLGAIKKRLIVKVAGGSAMFDTSDSMNIGKHNYVAMRKIFWQNGVMIEAEHVGDCISRTLRLNVADGTTTVGNRKLGYTTL